MDPTPTPGLEEGSCAAMSVVREHQTVSSSSILQRIPVELWSKILHPEQSFTIEDFKTLCFVAPLFKTICQPLTYKSLAVKSAKVPSRYSFERERGKPEMTHDVDKWKRDVEGLIRAERRLRLVGDDPSLSSFPKTISVGVMPGSTSFYQSVPQSVPQPPTTKMALSMAAYDAYSQFNATFVRTLPSFTHLRRVEIGLFPIADGLLRAIASLPVLNELNLKSCPFLSPTFPIPSIRLLEYNSIAKEQAPAAFRLASSHHLEELRIENMWPPIVLEGLRARTESESTFTKLHRLTIVLTRGTKLNLLDVESLLSYMPALRHLDVGEPIITVPEGLQAMRSSIIPHLRRLSGPLSFARYVVPGRPVSDIRSGHGVYGDFVETLPELQAHLHPLCSSAATAEGITTLHLTNLNIAPIWLLNRFVAETFPRLIDLGLPVGMIKPRVKRSYVPRLSCCGLRRIPRLPGVQRPFEERVVEEMVKNIRNKVENELVGGFDDPYHRAKGPDYATREVDPLPTPASGSSPGVDVTATLARFCTDVVLDRTGTPSRHPKDYQEALIYFARGWYPLPASIQALSLRPGSFPDDIACPSPFDLPPIVDQETCVAVVTALGERYPSLGSVTLMGSDGYRCERIRGMENGTKWSVLATSVP